MTKQGMLIVLEGLDGAGTTTQAYKIADELARKGVPVHVTRQPSSRPIGRFIREILAGSLGDETQDLVSLGLLFAADRADHVAREVRPALERGEVVISDRWYYSSIAYQARDDFERKQFFYLNRSWLAATKHMKTPDLVLFIDTPPAVAAQRRYEAGRTQELFDDHVTQTRVYNGYEATFKELRNLENIVRVKGDQPVGQVLEECLVHVEKLLKEHVG
jgi:dTMP kinase